MDGKKTITRILGSGIYNLDTNVVREYPDGPGSRRFTETVLGDEVGGTCGNVMCILAGLGLETYPQACLDDSPEGLRITEDLRRFGCDTRFVTNTPDGGTTLLRVTRKRFPDGSLKVSVRAGSPGSSRFPKRRFLRVRDQAPAFVQALQDAGFIPDFYFFDDPSAGHRHIAEALRACGTTVYFEPSAIASKADLECVKRSDIVKFSNENVPDASFADGFRDKLFVQTLGKEGLRYKFLDGDWKTLPPVVNAHVVDTEGAGDATTSALICGIARSGRRLRDLDEAELVRILADAQRFASESVSRLGTKAIPASTDRPASTEP
jgi:sugar/nucleoside kinase (ribokinase family)